MSAPYISDHWDHRAAYQARLLSIWPISSPMSPIIRREFLPTRPCPWCCNYETGEVMLAECLTCKGARVLVGRTV